MQGSTLHRIENKRVRPIIGMQGTLQGVGVGASGGSPRHSRGSLARFRGKCMIEKDLV
jgi:hypothetical protein